VYRVDTRVRDLYTQRHRLAEGTMRRLLTLQELPSRSLPLEARRAWVTDTQAFCEEVERLLAPLPCLLLRLARAPRLT
jgi:hypothetical protein